MLDKILLNKRSRDYENGHPFKLKKNNSYFYLTNRGRYRLGKITNPWSLAFLKIPLSLGFFWFFWFSQTLSETLYHLDQPYAQNKIKNKFLIIIPGPHMIMTYRLAKIILQMNIEDNYRAISPVLAFCLSIFPPFSVFYIQSALNHHWRRHSEESSFQFSSYLPTQNFEKTASSTSS